MSVCASKVDGADHDGESRETRQKHRHDLGCRAVGDERHTSQSCETGRLRSGRQEGGNRCARTLVGVRAPRSETALPRS